jgi:hypothetical protein
MSANRWAIKFSHYYCQGTILMQLCDVMHTVILTSTSRMQKHVVNLVNIYHIYLYICYMHICIYVHIFSCVYIHIIWYMYTHTYIYVVHPLSKIWNVLKSETFKWWHDATSGKFHTWPSVMSHNQNTGALKILNKVTIRVCIQNSYET